ncbi:unnamed protein product [Vicia faba]|uniref:Senescence domain-containing protein n=1 Tax=Vicia faba TaxID=3906 RepID=A0AAV0ZFI8_VICFA|nr:unnamed protein product [Vicia faba]
MGCCFRGSKTLPPMEKNTTMIIPKKSTLRQETLIQIPGCRVYLMDEGEAHELTQGKFMIIKIFDDNVSLATIIKIGNNVQFPLTKDEPVVKVDSLHYLFSLAVKDCVEPLSYGVTFPQEFHGSMALVDTFLKEHSCFSDLKLSKKKSDLDWEEFAPCVEDYNHFLAKAIAGGTGQIVKGIFMCSNAYTNQVQKGGQTILNNASDKKNDGMVRESMNNKTSVATKNRMNENLIRVRKLTNMTEKLSKSLLNGVGIVSGSLMAPVLKSQPGQAFLKMLPGEVLLASLDAVNKVFEAAEAAEKQTFSATSQAATRMVSNRYGEDAGEATEHVFASAGHAANTAWNVSKIRKTINPASSAATLRNSARNRYIGY